MKSRKLLPNVWPVVFEKEVMNIICSINIIWNTKKLSRNFNYMQHCGLDPRSQKYIKSISGEM
jgi:hypothetical protein